VRKYGGLPGRTYLMIEGRILLFGDDPKIARGLKKNVEKEAFTFS